MTFWMLGNLLRGLGRRCDGDAGRQYARRHHALLMARLFFLVFPGGSAHPGNSTALQMVCKPVILRNWRFQHYYCLSTLIGTLLGQGAWQQGVAIPQCQIRFGTNEKVSIIMVAGLTFTFTAQLIAIKHIPLQPWTWVFHTCLGQRQTVSSLTSNPKALC